MLSPSQQISEEANLSLDLDGDGIIAVNLGRSSKGEAVLMLAPAAIPVTDSSGLAVSSNRGDGWKALAVAVSGSGLSLYWGSSASQQVERWTLNASGVDEASVTL